MAIDFTVAGRGHDERAGAGAARHQRRARHDRLAGGTKPALRQAVADAGIGDRRRAEFLDRRRAVRGDRRACGQRCWRRSSEFGAWLHEAHHAAKKDAPSGTALMLKRAMEDAGFSRPIDVSSTRAGFIPGTHTIGFDGPAESITLTHTARDRGGFARGALDRGAVGQGPAAAGSRCRTCWDLSYESRGLS